MAESCFGRVKLLGNSSVNLATAVSTAETCSISAQTHLQYWGGCAGVVSAPTGHVPCHMGNVPCHMVLKPFACWGLDLDDTSREAAGLCGAAEPQGPLPGTSTLSEAPTGPGEELLEGNAAIEGDLGRLKK